jgi:hypothetical protein
VWIVDLENPGDHLKQGDLLKEVPLPMLSKKPAAEGDRWNIKFPSSPCLVISQCCTVEQKRVVQVAKILKTREGMDPTHPTYQALLSEWPAREGELMYDAMRLDPMGSALPELDGGRFWYADFRTGSTFTADPAWLKEHFQARMTAVSRRNLRMRLAGFYTRTTADDRAELEAGGEWSDLADAPPWVQRPRD